MIYSNGKPLREFRCIKCRSLLGKEYIYAGRLEIKCPNCNTMNVINFKTTKAEVDKLFSWKDKPKEVKN
jgi:phage FluMu protein Com